MNDTPDWGYAVMPDGTHKPLQEPPGLIPEDEREYIYESPRLTMWTRRADSGEAADE